MSTTRFKVQPAPDGRRFEVIEPATLHLFGSFWTREAAQARADELERDGPELGYMLPPTLRQAFSAIFRSPT